ncbi:MAG: DUF2156 domain-containing protein [Proteobacteria bacterium]|nr:DUF2156 domain-containing protein [Pseudomonadota bacterium]
MTPAGSNPLLRPLASTGNNPPLEGFQPLSLADKDRFNDYLRRDPPETSELTFSNLFMWRHHYRPFWAEADGFLFVVCAPCCQQPFGLPPVGEGDKGRAMDRFFERLSDAAPEPAVCRVGRKFVDRFVDRDRHVVTHDPDQSDYVYQTEDLIQLSGRKFHQKKNHYNQFVKRNRFEVKEMDIESVECVLDMQEAWCEMKKCQEDPSLLSEDLAICEALKHYEDLDYRGLCIVMEGKVEAFALGEELNPETVVIHIEKANPEIRGLYAAINQRFCREFWSGYPYVNREQDLGLTGLRQAKQSYNPSFMIEKYIVAPKAG